MTQNSAQERSALFATTLTSFMGPFMVSSVNVALPTIQAELSMNAVQLSWVATAYLLAMAVGLVPAGKMGDIYGRKKIFVTGLLVYTVTSTVTVFVSSAAWLITMRAAQGLGAAMFVTTGMAILTSIFPPQRRGRVLGIYVAAVYVGLSVGPFAGGLLTQHLGWRSIFLVMLPLGASSIVISLLFIKGGPADAQGQRLDLWGSLLYAVAICALIFGATLLPSPKAWLLMPFGLAALAAFVRQQNRTPHPVFEVALFRNNRTFTFSSLAAVISYAATYAITFLISLYLQYLKGMSPQAAGSVLMAQPVVMAIFSPFAGRLSDRIEPRLIASVGMGITAAGLAGFAFVTPETHLLLIVSNLAMLGFGFALFSSPNVSAILGSVQKENYGIASGAVATMRLLGQMASMAVATVVLAIVIGHAPIQFANYPLFLKSVNIIFALFSMLGVLGVYFSLSRGRLRSREIGAEENFTPGQNKMADKERKRP
jgi:EmrB/QacA subfamily drug resistance transporter